MFRDPSGHVSPCSKACLDEAICSQLLVGCDHGAARKLEPLRKLSTGRQFLAGQQDTRLDQPPQLGLERIAARATGGQHRDEGGPVWKIGLMFLQISGPL